MCETWDKNDNVDILDKFKEEWNKDYNSGNINPSGNDIPNSNKTLYTDVSIQIEMDDDPKTTNMVDINPYKYTVDSNPHHQDYNHNPTLPYNPNLVEDNINPLDTPTKVQIEMSVKNSTMEKENFPIGDVWGI
ncbi:erythrocyte membrane protein 1, PfEMP1, putative [Plasmodium sp. DRC-Itaito]|nr:erythrocyte membrane protein 1, PfEMP1, putative [Plasmodium sp. DRC-Itaito]